MFECSKCNIKFSYHFELIIHRSSHNIPTIYCKILCDICGVLCQNADHFKNHSSYHMQAVNFTCGRCKKEFLREKTYITHVKNCQPHLCTLCDKSFISNRNLIEHLRLHTKETPFQCETCQKVFVRKDKLSRHKETHKPCELTDKKNIQQSKVSFECNKCDKKYTRKSNLQLHELSHSDNFPAACEYCGQKFLRADHVQRHMSIHKYDFVTDECSCSVCGQRMQKNGLKSHMIAEHDETTPYKCTQCDKSFKQKGHLIYHKRSHSLNKD